MSTTSYNCTNEQQRAEGLAHAQKAIAAKQIIVMPTDTVYGVAADAFSPQAVATLLAAKGRGRNMPPPVLIPRIGTMEGLATDIPDDARKLAEKYWPGPLTLIFHAQPTLTWDLGETKGTVALRVPDEQLALDLLTITGPLAVSSANRTGQAAAQSGSEARSQLADSVEVYLEGGFRPLNGKEANPSTIVDATGLRLRVVREGAISLAEIQQMIPSALGPDVEPAMWAPVNLSKDADADLAEDSEATGEVASASETTGEVAADATAEVTDVRDTDGAVDAADVVEGATEVVADVEEPISDAADEELAIDVVNEESAAEVNETAPDSESITAEAGTPATNNLEKPEAAAS